MIDLFLVFWAVVCFALVIALAFVYFARDLRAARANADAATMLSTHAHAIRMLEAERAKSAALKRENAELAKERDVLRRRLELRVSRARGPYANGCGS